MSTLGSMISILFAVLPAWFAAVVLGILALTLLVIVIKLVGFILDAIPFL